MGKGQIRIVAALERIQLRRPFLLLGLRPDYGIEFLNWHLLRGYCKIQILLSRFRPEHKSNNC